MYNYEEKEQKNVYYRSGKREVVPVWRYVDSAKRLEPITIPVDASEEQLIEAVKEGNPELFTLWEAESAVFIGHEFHIRVYRKVP